MSTVHIKTNLSEVKSRLNYFEKSQFPFIYALTLTQTAEAARQGVQIQTRRVFKLSTEFIPRNIFKESAKKSDMKSFGFAYSSVFTGRRLGDWMGLQETGGTKKPSVNTQRDKGKFLAMPGKDLKKKKFRTKSGKVAKRWTPSRLLANFKGSDKTNIQRIKSGGKRTPFIIRNQQSNTPMLVRRASKSRQPLEVLYVFVKNAKITPKWGFERTVERVANAVFEKKLSKNLKKVLR